MSRRTVEPGTVAVVTGAGRGIGAAIAHALADRGHVLLVTDIDGAAAERTAAAIGRGAGWAQQDVRDPAGHAAVAKQASELGRLAVWVNNAGVLDAGPCWEHDDAVVARLMAININGAVYGSRTAVRAMSDTGGGAILNIASISAVSPIPGLALYAASKAAVLSFTTSLQADLDHAHLPIRARALCPDVVGTAMVADVANDNGAAMLFSGPAPLAPEAVAAAAVKLIDSRQVFRILPRWRGVIARSAGLTPSLGIPLTQGFRILGERRQRTHTPLPGGAGPDGKDMR